MDDVIYERDDELEYEKKSLIETIREFQVLFNGKCTIGCLTMAPFIASAKSREQAETFLKISSESNLVLQKAQELVLTLFGESEGMEDILNIHVDEKVIYSSSCYKQVYELVWMNDELFQQIDDILLAQSKKQKFPFIKSKTNRNSS